eukprot:m.213320 g.213320  ORF g.213320 m.213320 type:complete len:330 (+) comp16953_c0_seq3:344-1333(+)
MFDSDLTTLDWLTTLTLKCGSVELDAKQSSNVVAAASTSKTPKMSSSSSTRSSTSSTSSSSTTFPTLCSSTSGSLHQPSPVSALPSSGPGLIRIKSGKNHNNAAHALAGLPDTATLIAQALSSAQQTKPTGITSLQIVKWIVGRYPSLTKDQQMTLKTCVRQELAANPRFCRARKGKTDTPSCNACWILANAVSVKQKSAITGKHTSSAKTNKSAKQASKAASPSSNSTSTTLQTPSTTTEAATCSALSTTAASSATFFSSSSSSSSFSSCLVLVHHHHHHLVLGLTFHSTPPHPLLVQHSLILLLFILCSFHLSVRNHQSKTDHVQDQ